MQVESKLEICQSWRAQFLFGLQSWSSGHAYDNKRISILFLPFYLNYAPTMAQYVQKSWTTPYVYFAKKIKKWVQYFIEKRQT